jgi:membrane fusion protein (multidrug efflux system)
MRTVISWVLALAALVGAVYGIGIYRPDWLPPEVRTLMVQYKVIPPMAAAGPAAGAPGGAGAGQRSTAGAAGGGGAGGGGAQTGASAAPASGPASGAGGQTGQGGAPQGGQAPGGQQQAARPAAGGGPPTGGAPGGGGPGGPPRPTAVEAQTVKVDRVQVTLDAVGTLRADEQVTVSAEIEGRIAEIGFAEGRPVEKDQTLYRIDDTILRAELSQAMAERALAEANFERADTLLRQRSGTERQRDEAKFALDRSRANVELATTRLDKATIRAPFAGVVGLRSIGLGEYVTRGEALVTLQRIDPLKVDFRLPETDLPLVREGQALRITVDAIANRTFEGQIFAIDPQIDVNGRSVQLRANVPNPNGQLRPGLFARVEIVAAVREAALLVPESALVAAGRDRFVFVVRDGKAVRLKVITGWRRPGEVEIVDGLKPGDVVISTGQQRLREGGAVEIVGQGPSRG